MNTKKVDLSPELSESAAIYASALDEIGGKKNPKLAELLVDDDEDPKAERALKALKGLRRDEAQWAVGWFRGVADALGCNPVAVLRAGRLVKLDVEEAA